VMIKESCSCFNCRDPVNYVAPDVGQMVVDKGPATDWVPNLCQSSSITLGEQPVWLMTNTVLVEHPRVLWGVLIIVCLNNALPGEAA
jgi:hypothetical protein